MLGSMSSSEITDWMGYYQYLNEERMASEGPQSTVHPDEEIEEYY